MDLSPGPTELVAIIIALIALSPHVLNYIRQRRTDKTDEEHQESIQDKERAEASMILVEISMALLPQLEKRIVDLETALKKERDTLSCQVMSLKELEYRMVELELQNEALRRGVARLIHQLRSKDLVPVWDIDQMPNGIPVPGLSEAQSPEPDAEEEK